MDETPSQPDDREHPVIRFLDRPLVALIGLLTAMARLSRNVNVLSFNADPHDRLRIKRWENILQWPPQQRVGCATAVAIGLAIGGVIFWYGLK